MNSVTAPSRARASATNFVTSAVRSVKPVPEVCTVSCADTMVLAVMDERVVRETDLGAGMNYISRHVVPANAGTHNHRHSLLRTISTSIALNRKAAAYGSLRSQGRPEEGAPVKACR